MTISEQQQLGRAKNAILTFLEHRLYIPKVFLDTEWDGKRLDVLAIDRDGSGDVHAILLFARRYDEVGELQRGYQGETIAALVDELLSVPAHWRYIAAVESDQLHRAAFAISDSTAERTFSEDGIGRIGFLAVDAPVDGESKVKIEVRPERFRAKVAKLADEYLAQHTADWEIRA
jgi:hypothetical protein